MIKNLYLYWNSDFKNCPEIIKNCLESWKKHNYTWNIFEISNENIFNYIDFSDIIDFEKKKITVISLSDIIRLKLLKKYGGLWCDATTFCCMPLDDWLENNIQNDFFIFKNYYSYNLLISSFFIYSKKNSYIINKWHDAIINYINNSNIMGDFDNIEILESKEIWRIEKYNVNHYFCLNYLFEDLYETNEIFSSIIDQYKLTSIDTKYLNNYGLTKEINEQVKQHIDEIKAPFYKLSYKIDLNEFNLTNNCLKYLFSKL